MTIEKVVGLSQVEVTENGHVQVRIVTRIMEDGLELSKTFHRYVLPPGADLIDQPERVAAIAKVVWTDEVIAAYAELVSKQGMQT